MNLGSFIFYTFIGSAIWNSTLALLSYFLIDKWEVYFREITWGFIVIGVVFVCYLVYKAIKRKNNK
jgi:membrane protein DedA with SNARE-associated domain